MSGCQQADPFKGLTRIGATLFRGVKLGVLLLLFSWCVFAPKVALSDGFLFSSGAVTTAPEEPEPPASCDEAGSSTSSNGSTDPVNVVRGEFFLTPAQAFNVEPVIPVRGLTLDLSRTYRSQFQQNGVLGPGWDLRLHRRLRQRTDGSVVVSTGTCREMLFTFDGSVYSTPPGVAAVLVQNPDGSYSLTFADGLVWEFDSNGLLTEERDRFGNAISLTWSSSKHPVYGVPRYFIPDSGNGPSDPYGSVTALDFRIEAVRDPIDTPGREILLAYDTDGHLETITDWEGRVWSYGYTNGNLTDVTAPPTDDHPSGATTTFLYEDPAHPSLITGIVSPALQGTGRKYLDQTYDDQARVEEQRLAAGGTVTLDNDEANQETTVTDANGNVTVYAYNTSRQIVSETAQTRGIRPPEDETATEYTTSYAYDSLGRRTQITFPEGDSIEWVYPANPPNPLERGNLQEIRRHPKTPGEPVLTTQVLYKTQFNQIGTITDPKNQVTEYFYDETKAGAPLEKIVFPTVPEGTPETVFIVNNSGLITDIEDPNDLVTHFDYDSNGYLSGVTRAFGTALAATSEFDPDSLGRPTVFRDENQHETALVFSEWNQLVSLTTPSPFSDTTTRRYDANGNLRFIDRDSPIAGDPQTTEFTYDDRDRLKTVKDELENEVEFFYDDYGSRIAVEDAEDHRTEIARDERHFVFTVTDAELRTTTFNYHGNGTLVEVVDGEGQTTAYDFDDYDRLYTITYEDGTASPTMEVFGYDANSNLEARTTRAGQLHTFGWDARDQQRMKVTPEETTTLEYDLGGRLAFATVIAAGGSTPEIKLEFGYNERNQLEKERVIELSGFPGTLPFEVATQWDGAGNVTEVTYPAGPAITQVPDAMNRVHYLQQPAGTSIVENTYDELSQLITRLFVSGAGASMTYDEADESM